MTAPTPRWKDPAFVAHIHAEAIAQGLPAFIEDQEFYDWLNDLIETSAQTVPAASPPPERGHQDHEGEMSAAVEYFRDTAGQYRWRLRAANGELVASSEAYTRRRDAVRGYADFVATVETVAAAEAERIAAETAAFTITKENL